MVQRTSCLQALLAPSLRELSAKLTEGVPRAAARVLMQLAAKIEVAAADALIHAVRHTLSGKQKRQA